MDFKDILSVALASLIVLVLAHLAVYWVVKTLYPPTPQRPSEVQQEPAVFTEAPVTQQQDVRIPTYEAPVPAEAPREEGERRGPPPPEATSIHGESRVVTSNTQ